MHYFHHITENRHESIRLDAKSHKHVTFASRSTLIYFPKENLSFVRPPGGGTASVNQGKNLFKKSLINERGHISVLVFFSLPSSSSFSTLSTFPDHFASHSEPIWAGMLLWRRRRN
ncbi:hypothetical protein GWI33_016904 [Rhynchophorus ferrugineus]|uniref:Uncharacterized protein n=1 Tax=Rhynchophorus ferrugineus TaxID=354439 RepID=A0A834M9U1_RHYFE|nr:hypothetical protein GWI33_016904 [Rhynchophorus ferrugineus]